MGFISVSASDTLKSAEYKPNPSPAAPSAQTAVQPENMAPGITHATIDTQLTASANLGITKYNTRKNFNTFEGVRTTGQVDFNVAPHVTETIKGQAWAGEAYFHTPAATLTIPGTGTDQAQTVTHEKMPASFLTRPDFGGKIKSDTAISLGLPDKGFGPDKIVGIDPKIHVEAQVIKDSLEHGHDVGVYITAAKVLNGAARVDVGTTLNSASDSITGYVTPRPRHFNARFEVTDMQAAEHGVSGLFHKIGRIFHHHHKNQDGQERS
jgi:hypothetical protein